MFEEYDRRFFRKAVSGRTAVNLRPGGTKDEAGCPGDRHSESWNFVLLTQDRRYLACHSRTLRLIVLDPLFAEATDSYGLTG